MQFISPNELLTALPPVIYERLGPHLQRVRLVAGGILFDVGAPIDCAWFITSGIVSLLGVTEEGNSVEVAMASCDSVIGFPGIVRKNETAFRAQVQIAGEALRVSAKVLQAAIKQESQIYSEVRVVWEQSRFRSGNHPQHFAILCNLIYLQARVCKARLNGQYRKGYEIATESKSGAN